MTTRPPARTPSKPGGGASHSRPTPASGAKSREISVPREELEFTYARSSGAGGQNVNKVNSKAILRWNPQSSVSMSGAMRERFFEKFGSKLTNDGEVILMSDVHRDQGRNAAECLQRLKDMIKSIAVPPKKRVATKPTYGSKVRRLSSKKANSAKKQGRRDRGDD